MKPVLIATYLILMLGLMGDAGFHQFKIEKLNSAEEIDLSQYKGKKILVVNVASECGYTPQYADLQKFYEMYKDQLVVIGFPCNQFGGQEPGTEADIASFCQKNYGVTFPVSTKIDVKGANQHPVYKWLTTKAMNGVGDYDVSWNFNKFLISENGELMGYFPSNVNPFDEAILSKL